MEDFDTAEDRTLNRNNKAGEEISKYLKVMNVEHTLDHKIKGIPVPLYLTKQKTVINLMPNNQINFDKFTFTGVGALSIRLYKTLMVEDESFTYLSISDFFKTPDNMSKLNYLISQGIDNENLSGTFDFSEISPDATSSSDEDGTSSSDSDAEDVTEAVDDSEVGVVADDVIDTPESGLTDDTAEDFDAEKKN